MSINKFSGHLRSMKLYFSATVLTLGLKAKNFENFEFVFENESFGGNCRRTRPTFDHCVSFLCRRYYSLSRILLMEVERVTSHKNVSVGGYMYPGDG